MNSKRSRHSIQKEWKRYIEIIKTYPEVQSKSQYYMSARGYDSWPHVQAHMYLLCAALTEIATSGAILHNKELEASVEAASVAMVALANDAPFRHLGADLARAFIATKPLPCLGDEYMPYPIFILNLPCGLLLDDTGANVNTIIVASYNYWIAKCREKGINITGDRQNMQAGGLQVVGLSDDGTQLVRTVCWDEAHESKIPVNLFCGQFDSNLVANAVDRMMRIVLNSMSAMIWRKDLLTTETPTAGSGFRANSNAINKRPVYWIGKNYIRKQASSTTTTESTGSKSPHWRSGHWHTVKHGQQRQKAKLLWFEPIYVNAAAKP